MGQQVTTAALVIGCIPYGDKSQIMKLWTRSLGLQAYMLYSSHGKSAVIKPSMLMPLTALQCEVTFRNKGQLERVKDATAMPRWMVLQSNPMKQAFCMFLSEVLLKTLRDGESTEAFFDEMMDLLMAIDQGEQAMHSAALKALLIMTQQMGFGIDPRFHQPTMVYDLKEGCFCFPPMTHHEGSSAADCQTLINWMRDDSHPMDGATKSRLVDALLSTLRLHHPNMAPIKSLDILRSLT